MNNRQQNYYGIRPSILPGTAIVNQISSHKLPQFKGKSKKSINKRFKQKLQQSSINQTGNRSESQKFIFLQKYKLVPSRNKKIMFQKKNMQQRSISNQSKITRKASYIRLADQQRIRQISQASSSPKRLVSNSAVSCSFHRKVQKSPSLSILPNENMSYQKISSKNEQNSISTRPASSNKLCMSFIHNLNNKELSQGSQKIKTDKNSIIVNGNNEEQKKLQAYQLKFDLNNKHIPEQPQSNFGSASNYSSKVGSLNSINSRSSKFKSIVLLPLDSKRREYSNQCSLNASSMNNQLQGYLIVEACLERINILAKYSQQIIEKYEDISDWDQLVFLFYKKFYLQRKKMVRALLYDNAKFFTDFIQTKKHKRKFEAFIRHFECQKLIEDLVFQNLTIEQSLRDLYNLIIEKSGDYINLHELDNFTLRIFKLLFEEITVLKQIYEMDKQQVEKRLKNVLACSEALANIDKLEFSPRLQKLVEQVNKIKIVTIGALFDKVQLFFKTQIFS